MAIHRTAGHALHAAAELSLRSHDRSRRGERNPWRLYPWKTILVQAGHGECRFRRLLGLVGGQKKGRRCGTSFLENYGELETAAFSPSRRRRFLDIDTRGLWPLCSRFEPAGSESHSGRELSLIGSERCLSNCANAAGSPGRASFRVLGSRGSRPASAERERGRPHDHQEHCGRLGRFCDDQLAGVHVDPRKRVVCSRAG